MKSIFVRFGVWLLRPVVDQLVQERLEEEEKEWLDALKPFFDAMRGPMGLAEEKASDQEKAPGGRAT